MRITAVVVSWNVKDLVTRCLESLRSEGDVSGHIVETWVVDNASSDGTPDHLRQVAPWANLISNGENRGFAAACNQGVMAAAPADAILLLNPDAILLPGALDLMARHLTDHPAVGAVGPRMLNADGTLQPSRRRFPTLATAFWESSFLQQCFPRNPTAQRYYYADRDEGATQPVDWLMGACLMIRRAAWDDTGGLDEGFFLYFEETDWFKRGSDLGWGAIYLPAAAAVHKGGGSADQAPARRHICFADSKGRYYAKHFGRGWGVAVRVFLMADVALRILEDAAKLTLGHQVAMRRRRIATLGAVLRWGLRG